MQKYITLVIKSAKSTGGLDNGKKCLGYVCQRKYKLFKHKTVMMLKVYLFVLNMVRSPILKKYYHVEYSNAPPITY